MLENLFTVLLYSAVAGLVALLAAQLVILNRKISDKKMIYLISFSAGILFALAFIHLLPEAMYLNPGHALYAVIGAFVAFYLLEQQIMMHSCSEGKCSHHHIDKGKGLVGLWGIMLHSFIDGALIGIGFEVSITLGMVTSLAVLVHKVPDGFSVSTIMIHSGFSRNKALKGSALVAAATPIGAILAYFLLQDVSNEIVGLALGLSAGTFLYISASDLIPETHRNVNWLNGAFVILGIAVIILAKNLIV
jgi:ZIP family zinc transporter/zinc and cadmium transporter